jgi:uncharacterized membrane protein YjjP (DUF1212 family)
VPSGEVDRSAAAGRFVAALGATMAAANYPVTMVRGVMAATSKAYGLVHQFLALPKDVQVVSPTGDGLYIANPDFDLRYDQSFPLAQLVARAPSGTVDPADGLAELDRIRNLDKRFPVWITVGGYAAQNIGLALVLRPTRWSPVGAATLGLLILSQPIVADWTKHAAVQGTMLGMTLPVPQPLIHVTMFIGVRLSAGVS